MSRTNKTKRYTLRLNPYTFERLHEIAEELHTSLADLMIIGAMSMHAKAPTPEEYINMKAMALVKEIRERKTLEI